MPTDNSQEVKDPKDEETSDWTDVDKLEKSHATPYSVEKLATSKVPHNIPYLEVYRTDELYYIPYTSPFLSSGVDGTTSAGGDDGTVGADGSGGSGNGTGGGVLWTELAKIMQTYYPKATANYWIPQLRKAPNTWTGVAKVVNKLGGDKGTQNNVIRKVLEAKKKFPYDSKTGQMTLGGKGVVDQVYSTSIRMEKLRKELLEYVKKTYISGIHHSVIVKRYIEANNNKYSIGAVTWVYRKYLRSGISNTTVNKKVLKIKQKYSK